MPDFKQITEALSGRGATEIFAVIGFIFVAMLIWYLRQYGQRILQSHIQLLETLQTSVEQNKTNLTTLSDTSVKINACLQELKESSTHTISVNYAHHEVLVESCEVAEILLSRHPENKDLVPRLAFIKGRLSIFPKERNANE